MYCTLHTVVNVGMTLIDSLALRNSIRAMAYTVHTPLPLLPEEQNYTKELATRITLWLCCAVFVCVENRLYCFRNAFVFASLENCTHETGLCGVSVRVTLCNHCPLSSTLQDDTKFSSWLHLRIWIITKSNTLSLSVITYTACTNARARSVVISFLLTFDWESLMTLQCDVLNTFNVHEQWNFRWTHCRYRQIEYLSRPSAFVKLRCIRALHKTFDVDSIN